MTDSESEGWEERFDPRAVLIVKKHPTCSCLVEALRSLDTKDWGDVPTPDVTVPPHERGQQ